MDPTLGCAPNFRDIGGLPAAGGRHVAFGRVFRSEAVLAPGESDAAALGGHGIRLVCDLRSRHERKRAPNHWWQAQGAELLELDVNVGFGNVMPWEALRTDPSAAGARQMMLNTYRALPEAAAGHLRQLFARIAAGHLPLVVHCTAGKDRTGVVMALLLSALGTPRASIYDDYLRSGTCMHPQIVLATAEFFTTEMDRTLDSEALAVVCGIAREYLDASFTAIDAAHGSLEAYLHDAVGLTTALANRVQQALLEAGPPRAMPRAKTGDKAASRCIRAP